MLLSYPAETYPAHAHFPRPATTSQLKDVTKDGSGINPLIPALSPLPATERCAVHTAMSDLVSIPRCLCRYERHIVYPKLLAQNAEDFNSLDTMYNRDPKKAGTARRSATQR